MSRSYKHFPYRGAVTVCGTVDQGRPRQSQVQPGTTRYSQVQPVTAGYSHVQSGTAFFSSDKSSLCFFWQNPSITLPTTNIIPPVISYLLILSKRPKLYGLGPPNIILGCTSAFHQSIWLAPTGFRKIVKNEKVPENPSKTRFWHYRG